QAEDGIRDRNVTGVQTCALPILEEAQNYTAKGFELPAEGPKPKKDVSVFPWGTEFVGDGKLEVMVRVNDGKSIQFLMVPMAEERSEESRVGTDSGCLWRGGYRRT